MHKRSLIQIHWVSTGGWIWTWHTLKLWSHDLGIFGQIWSWNGSNSCRSSAIDTYMYIPRLCLIKNQVFLTYNNYNHNCAISFKGGWWYKHCHGSNQNGRYLTGHHTSYVCWWNKLVPLETLQLLSQDHWDETTLKEKRYIQTVWLAEQNPELLVLLVHVV